MSRFLSARRRGRGLVCVLAALMALPLVTSVGPAVADDRPPVSCPDGICFSPPPLLSLDRGAGAAAATPARVASLRKLEKQAVETVITMHGLSASDTNAVLAWGRPEAQAQLFALLLKAIEASPRTVDQQNAVDWLAAMAQDKAVAAANAAGREYLKWAGLYLGQYEQLLNRNASEDELREFLNDPVNALGPGGGYCDYWPPAPYESEFSTRDHQTCSTPCTGLFGCLPQPPSFEQLVKWGQAAASYDFLNSEEFSRTAHKVATAIGVSVAVYAAISSGTAAAVAMGTGVAAVLDSFATMSTVATWVPSSITPFSGIAAAGVGSVAAIVVVAIVIAVMEGIAVVTAAELPGQLAELIVDARTDPPDVAELMDTADGMTTLLATFVAATLPAPVDDSCDNSQGPWFEFVPEVWALRSGPCLNAPAIPAASPLDPQFVITEKGKSGRTVSSTITWRDPASGTTPTARLHDNWFITEPTGALDEQMLSISYTGWDGEPRSAYVLGDPDHGHAFVSLNVSGDLTGLEDCLDNGLCSASETLRYLGPNGEKLSTSLERWSPPVGAPAYDPTPDEEYAVTYKANGFAPGNATGAVSYRWRFEQSDCRMMCTILAVGGGTPYEAATVAGKTVTHRWGHPGTFTVELTATDSENRSATTTFEVQAQDVAPRIVEFVPDCPANTAGDPLPSSQCLPRTGATGTARQLRGAFIDASTLHKLVAINWGDGSPEVRECVTDLPPDPPFHCNPVAGNGLEVTPANVAGTRGFAFDASHVYAEPGVYQGTVTVSDQLGASTETFTMTIGETPAVVVTTHTHDGVVKVAEDGATSRDLDVRLGAAPAQDVTIYFAVDNHHDVDVPETITFTPDNWDQPQTVTVRAVDDDHHEPNPHRATITIGVRGAPEAKVDIDRDNREFRSAIAVEIADNDQAGVIVSPTSLALTEGGAPATVTVGVTSTPTDGTGVEVRAVARGLCAVTPDRLTNIRHRKPQTLTVTPGRDHHPGGRHCTVHIFTRSSDPDYADRRVDITGTVTNIDIPAVTVSATHVALDTTEANPAATYQLVLDTMPIADVEITPTTTDPDVRVSGPVIFTADNWDQPQTVTVSTPAGTTPHAAVITHEVTTDDTDYTAIIPADVHVAVGDPATTLTLSATPDQPTTTRPATDTDTLTADVGDPTGNVVFSVDEVSPCDVGSPDCGGAIVHGVAQFHPGPLGPGTHTITATYPGDGPHRSASATIELVVTPGTPEPVDDTITLTENAEAALVDVLANDPAGLPITGNTAAAHGDVACDETSCSYTPNRDFHGTDTFTYTVTDGAVTATATVIVAVEPVDDPLPPTTPPPTTSSP